MKKAGIAVGVITVIAVIAYYFLGGFKEPVIQLSTVTESQYHGRWFEGRINNDSIRIIFEEARQFVSQHGEAVAIHYPQELEQESDTIRQFIGVWHSSGDQVQYPAEFRPFDQLAGNSYISVQLTQHPIVMPAPAEIREMAQAFAERQNYSLQAGSIELYYPDNRIEVLFAVQSLP